MKDTFLNWLDDRTQLISGLRSLGNQRLRGGSCPCHTLKSMITCDVVVLSITGFFLWCFYSPSSQTAWESVYYIQYILPAGWIVRGLHNFSAQLLVALSIIFVLKSVFSGSYRRSREFVFWGALVIGLFALAGCLTGDLLAWTNNGYSATLTRTRFLYLLPGIGGPLFKIATGGPAAYRRVRRRADRHDAALALVRTSRIEERSRNGRI